jgi:hypothetical protein
LAPAEHAFQEAVAIFDKTMTGDPKKQNVIKQATSMESLVQTIETAKTRYDGKHENQNARKWLTKVAFRVRFYGNICDVFMSHHPEYTALAWGAFKTLFVVR